LVNQILLFLAAPGRPRSKNPLRKVKFELFTAPPDWLILAAKQGRDDTLASGGNIVYNGVEVTLGGEL
jgi:hypothetical protein